VRRVLIPVFLAASAVLVPVAPASAAARVTLANDAGDAAVDPTYATTLSVKGTGFQSIQGGHGGIYVFFGTVKGRWKPSQGGQTGANYLYVPDSESADNQGYQDFVAFPGSDTASSASASMGRDGSWSASITVPGATFQAYDRNGDATTVDCRKVICGVITVGAHGVVNAENETFTPVTVTDLYAASSSPSASAAPSASPAPSASVVAPPTPGREIHRSAGETDAGAAPELAALEVDRGSAHPGNVLAFSAAGLTPGGQVSAVLDDGAAGAGPFQVGADGGVAGVVTIPASVQAGTHELRLFGVEEPPSVSFAVTDVSTPDAAPTEAVAATAATVSDGTSSRVSLLFAAGSLAVLALAVVRLVTARRRSGRA